MFALPAEKVAVIPFMHLQNIKQSRMEIICFEVFRLNGCVYCAVYVIVVYFSNLANVPSKENRKYSVWKTENSKITILLCLNG